MQQLPQSAAESIRMQGARSGQLGGWFENAGHDQGHDQIEFAAGLRVDEPVEMQAAQGAEDRGHVAVRAGADDIEGLRKRGADGSGALQDRAEGANGSGALQDRAEGVELSGGPMGEVGKRAVADLAAETKRLAKEDSGRGVAVGHCGDIHPYIIQISEHNSKYTTTYYMTTQ